MQRGAIVLGLLVPLLAGATGGEEVITAGALLEEVRILASPAMVGAQRLWCHFSCAVGVL